MVKPVQLQRIKEFEQALKDYTISDRAKMVLARTKLVILLGVFGSGRNSIIDELVKSGAYHYIISDTTRPPKVRNSRLETDGVHYYFRDEGSILRDIENGEFLEAEIIHNQQVSGISIRELERASASGQVAICDVDLQGTLTIMHNQPSATMIFIVPPSFDDWTARINGRETMSPDEFRNRMVTAEKILTTVLTDQQQYKFVINNTLAEATARVDELVHKGAHSAEHNAQARQVASTLLVQVKQYLAS